MRLYQVFANLIGNAVAHMGPCQAPRIEVEVAEESVGWRLTVRDNGRGVDPAHHERIFGMFQTASGCGDRGGTGIGLAIVKKVAEVHGGRAWVESRPGAGASFHVTLSRD
jgi:signal transduction histidine kinase